MATPQPPHGLECSLRGGTTSALTLDYTSTGEAGDLDVDARALDTLQS
jgi:hypothetical protein